MAYNLLTAAGGRPGVSGSTSPLEEIQRLGRPNRMLRDVARTQTEEERAAQERSLQDRATGVEELWRSRGALDADPRMNRVWEYLNSQYSRGGPFTPQMIEQGKGTLRSSSALGLQGAQRSAAEDLARRGMGGSLSAYEQAGLGQRASTDLASQIADWERQAALANEAAMQQYLSQMGGQATSWAAMRQAIDDQIARAFLDYQHQAPDLMSAHIAAREAGRNTKV